MSLIDVLNGMQNGPRGETAGQQGGMSKLTMALLAFLGYKAYKNMTSANAPAHPSRPYDETTQYPSEPGGLAGVLRTIFGGGSVPGGVVTRGVPNTVDDFDRNGDGDAARSWVQQGPNRPIAPARVAAALGQNALQDLMDRTGLPRDELLEALSEHLPRLIDHLTPNSRYPTEEEASRMT